MGIRVFRPLIPFLAGCLLILAASLMAMGGVLPGDTPETDYEYNNYYVLPGLSGDLFFTINGVGCVGEDGERWPAFTLVLEVPDDYDDIVNIFFFDPGCKLTYDENGPNELWDSRVSFSVKDKDTGEAVSLLLEGNTKKPVFSGDPHDSSWSGMYSFTPEPGTTYQLTGVLKPKSDAISNAGEKNGFRMALGPIFDETPVVLNDGDETLTLTVSAGDKRGGGSGSGSGEGSGGGGMPEDKGPGQEETEARLMPVLKVYFDEHAEKLFAGKGEVLYFVELPDPDVSDWTLEQLTESYSELEATLRGVFVGLKTYDLQELPDDPYKESLRCIHMPTGQQKTRKDVNIPATLALKKAAFPHIGLEDYLDALAGTEESDDGEDGGPPNDNDTTNGNRPEHPEEETDEPPVMPVWGLAAVHVTLSGQNDFKNEWSLWTRQVCDTDMMETGIVPLLMPEPPFILAPRGLSASLWRWYFETALTELEGITGGSGTGHPREGGSDESHIREGTVPSPEELLSFLSILNYGEDGTDSCYDYGGGFSQALGDEVVAESFYFTFDTGDPVGAIQKAKDILSFMKSEDTTGETWVIAAQDSQVRCRVQMFALALNGIWNREMFKNTPYPPVSGTGDDVEDHSFDGGIWTDSAFEPWVYLPRELVLWLYEDVDGLSFTAGEGYYLKSITDTVSDFLQGYSLYGDDETRGLFHFLEILNDNPVGWYPLQVPSENTSCGG